MATRLYVGNLAYNTTEGELLDLFKQAGNVVSCDLIVDRNTERSKGFAFVEMGSEEDAGQAISQLNGKELGGRTLTVNEARPRPERPRSFAEAGVGSRRDDKRTRRY
ncbi:MAG TPA: RNA-binding protein [Verrucomicrobiae bacterium]|nr:RNA-binding protein [Verrucomicrobiae bacterium]